MKMNLQGIDIELTPEEFVKMQELLYSEKKPHEMTFNEEFEFIEKLRHFKIIEIDYDGAKGYLKLECDIR